MADLNDAIMLLFSEDFHFVIIIIVFYSQSFSQYVSQGNGIYLNTNISSPSQKISMSGGCGEKKFRKFARKICLPGTGNHLPQASGQGFCRALVTHTCFIYRQYIGNGMDKFMDYVLISLNCWHVKYLLSCCAYSDHGVDLIYDMLIWPTPVLL